MIHSDIEASAIYHPEVREMEHLERLMAESSIHPRLDLVPYHPAMQLPGADVHELALLDHENERMRHLHSLNAHNEMIYLRDRELDEMHLMDRERHLDSINHQRTIALEDEYRLRQGHGLASGYGPIDGSTGYGLAHPYPATMMSHPSYHSPSLLYPGVMADPYYQQMTSTLPRSLPMFSDPYFMNQMAFAGSRNVHSTLPLNYTMQNPFLHGIDHDYGYGAIGPLKNYGLVARSPPREYGQMLDDLYLYEMMLRLDRALVKGERILRWRERLAWEELDLAERRLLWEQMNMMERSRLGLGMGSFWGHQLGGLPINSTFGYASPNILAEEVMVPYGRAPIMGVLDGPHYPLSSPLMPTYPMWDVGGLGVGARISPWLSQNDMFLSPRQLARQENIRREYAERRGEIPPGPRFIEADEMSNLIESQMLRPKHLIRQENIRREYAERRGEIPPVPRLIEPGRLGAGIPLYAACSENYRVY
ncbi:hypothetical protein PGTUg99_017244 [Puccinia graminis f. sp. tritici]|uniref:Uncharacterized protein n=1 Tax=Puccinia graminis f. sp. tritici TaxID=56615 RepID=A0A5B0MVJ6_PUCGR|nr:hypothetical protein PGTUg99_017244 [Puccinia graminis f. sp. tritici]